MPDPNRQRHTPQRQRPPQIIVFGGCGVADQWTDLRPFRYAIAATACERPQVLLLSVVATGDGQLIEKLHRAYRRLGASTVEWHDQGDRPKSGMPETDPRECDLIHVEGGNTAFLLDRLGRLGLGRQLREAWSNGVVMTGTSAGASCWFSQAIGASLFAPVDATDPLQVHSGLGLLPHSICVHYDAAHGYRDAYCAAIRNGLQPGFGLDHDAGLHFEGTQLKAVLSGRPPSTASTVQLQHGRVVETRMASVSLGRPPYGTALRLATQSLRRQLRRASAKWSPWPQPARKQEHPDGL